MPTGRPATITWTGPTTYITDVNCPHTAGVTKAASRIFAPSSENVRYCAAGSARDWTTASNAGFLAAGLQQDTKGAVNACGTFQDSLVVLFEDSAQIWNVAVNPVLQRDQTSGCTASARKNPCPSRRSSPTWCCCPGTASGR
jgi:hypothetical protein